MVFVDWLLLLACEAAATITMSTGRVPPRNFCPRGLIFKRAGSQSSSCQHWCAAFRLLSSCKSIDHPGVTVHAVGKSSLRLYLPPLDPAHQPHPGEHLRQGEGQGEVVGDIVIAPCTKLKLQPSPRKSTHTPWIKGVGCSAALDQLGLGGDRDG